MNHDLETPQRRLARMRRELDMLLAQLAHVNDRQLHLTRLIRDREAGLAFLEKHINGHPQ